MRNQPYLLCSLFDRLNEEASNKKVRKGFRLIWHSDDIYYLVLATSFFHPLRWGNLMSLNIILIKGSIL
jgi:hypothetical protein